MTNILSLRPSERAISGIQYRLQQLLNSTGSIMDTEVIIAGTGLVPFRKTGQSEPYDVMGQRAARLSLEDAGIA